jgi:hypothetical protein
MISFITPEPSGTGKLHEQIRDLRRIVRSQKIRPSNGSKVVVTAHGTTVDPARPSGGGDGEGGSDTWA